MNFTSAVVRLFAAPVVVTTLVALSLTGCHVAHHAEPPPIFDLPRELDKVTQPPYIIEPPDILVINAVRLVPKPPYRIQSLDVLSVQVEGAFTEYPITGNYSVEPGGVINLGPQYGSVTVAGMSIDDARSAIQKHLETILQSPTTDVQLAQAGAMQQISGEHLVGPDGTVMLGVYGSVMVAGMTKEGARNAIEAHLAQSIENPQISLDVVAYNSKVYYVITQGAGYGDGVYKLPVTGGETLLDAIANVEGLQPHSSLRIWIARPAPAGTTSAQIIPVDWNAITQGAVTDTNYQILPGDRIYIAEDKLVALDSYIARITAPAERVLGFTLLGTNTVKQIRFFHRFQGGASGGGGF